MSMNDLRVLVIEDNPLHAQFIENMLGRSDEMSFQVDISHTLQAGLQKATSQQPDVVLLDLDLPDSQGENTIESATGALKETPVVILTGRDDNELALRAVRQGAQDYLSKTDVNQELLVRTIHYAVERMSAQKALKESESVFGALVDVCPDSVIATDLSGWLTEVSRRTLELHGYTQAEEMVGRNVLDFIDPGDRDRIQRCWERTFELGSLLNQECCMLRQDGGSFTGEISIAVIKGASGDPRGFIATVRDVTARKSAERALLQSEERFRSAFELAPVGMYLASPEGWLVLVNRALCDILGYSERELQKMRLSAIITHGEQESYQELRAKMLRGDLTTSKLETRFIHHSGATIVVQESILLLRTADGVPVYFVAHVEDITKRKELEGQLLQAQKLESIGQLAAGIAHEINTPAQYIGDNIAFLRDACKDIVNVFDKYRELTDAARSGAVSEALVAEVDRVVEDADCEFLLSEIPQAIDQSLDGIGKVSEIVGAMKEFSHPGTGVKTPSDLNRAIATTLSVARNEWKHVANVKTEFDDALPLVPCMPGELNQALLNLIINSAQAIGEKKEKTDQKDKGNLSIHTQRTGDFAEVRITDDGCGIPAHIRERIFDPFFTTKALGKGTGQGLAMVHSVLVGKHGGELQVDSEEGEGTTFILRLPLESSEFSAPPGPV